MTRTMHDAALALACAAIIAMLSHVAAGQTGGAPGQTNASDGNTLPSSETVRSVVMNNWADSVAIHYARQLYQADQEHFGPYLAALHGAADWTMNQIDGATAFFGTEVLDGTGASSSG